MCRLAYWSGRAGDAAGARDQLTALLPLRERVLGPEHPQVLTARHELAYWTEKAEAAARPRHDQSKRVLRIFVAREGGGLRQVRFRSRMTRPPAAVNRAKDLMPVTE